MKYQRFVDIKADFLQTIIYAIIHRIIRFLPEVSPPNWDMDGISRRGFWLYSFWVFWSHPGMHSLQHITMEEKLLQQLNYYCGVRIN